MVDTQGRAAAAHRAIGSMVARRAGRVGCGVEHVGRQWYRGLVGIAGAQGCGGGRVQHGADGVHHPGQAGWQAHHIQPVQPARIVLQHKRHSTSTYHKIWPSQTGPAISHLAWSTDSKQQEAELLQSKLPEDSQR